jgi:hypothetical protein
MPHYSLKSMMRHIEKPASGGNFRKCKISRGNIVRENSIFQATTFLMKQTEMGKRWKNGKKVVRQNR